MQFDLVSPERRLASLEAESVLIPGAEGDMTVMAEHAPVISTLRPGVLRVEGAGETQEFVVSGGFAEINGAGVTVLAELAVPRGEMSQETMDRMFEAAQNTYNQAKSNFENQPGPVDDAAKLLADMVAMGDEIGLSTKQPSL